MRVRRRPSHPTAASLILVAALLLAATSVLRAPALGDVEVYRAGGRAALAGGDIYGFRFGDHGFTYPPFAALAFGAVARLPLAAVWAVLAIMSWGALVVVFRLCAPDLIAGLRVGHVPSALALGALLLAQPVTATVRWGQVNLVLAALVLVDLLVLRRGLLIGLATAVKLTPGLFVVFLLLRRRRREAAAATAAFAATVAAAWCVLPSESMRYWTRAVISGAGVGGFDHPGNQSVRGLAERLVGTTAGTIMWTVLAPLVLMWGLALGRRLASTGQEVAAAGTVGVTACLISPVSWTHHWVWVVPLLAACVQCAAVPAAARNTAFALVVIWTLVPPARIEVSWLRVLDTGYVPAALVAGLVATFRCWLPAEAPRTNRVDLRS